jgi:hypothetical protein
LGVLGFCFAGDGFAASVSGIDSGVTTSPLARLADCAAGVAVPEVVDEGGTVTF